MYHLNQTAKQGLLRPSLQNTKEHWAPTVFCSMDKFLPTSITGCRTFDTLTFQWPTPSQTQVSKQFLLAPQILPSCDFDEPSLGDPSSNLLLQAPRLLLIPELGCVSSILKTGYFGSSDTATPLPGLMRCITDSVSPDRNADSQPLKMNHATTFPPWPSWRTLDFIYKAHLISAHLWVTAISVSCPRLSHLEWLAPNWSPLLFLLWNNPFLPLACNRAVFEVSVRSSQGLYEEKEVSRCCAMTQVSARPGWNNSLFLVRHCVQPQWLPTHFWNTLNSLTLLFLLPGRLFHWLFRLFPLPSCFPLTVIFSQDSISSITLFIF